MGAHTLRDNDNGHDAEPGEVRPVGYCEWAAEAGGLALGTRHRPEPRRDRRETRSPDLRFETMVSVTEAFGVLARNGELPREMLMLWICCRGTRSIAELASTMDLPYEQGRILVWEAFLDGLLHVHPDSCESEGIPRLDVVVRLRHGLLQMD